MQYDYAILVLRLVKQSVLMLNTLVSHYQKLFSALILLDFLLMKTIHEKTIIWNCAMSEPRGKNITIRITTHYVIELLTLCLFVN